MKTTQVQNLENLQEMQEKQTKTIIPHYITEASIKYNHYILPIYLYLKRRKNIDNEIFFDYNSLLKYYQEDKFTKTYEQQILTALIFLFSGVKEIGTDTYGTYTVNEKTQYTFQINKRHNVLNNIFSNVTILIDTDEDTFKINSDNFDIKELIKLLINQLNTEEEILLYDNTTIGVIGYILINNSLLNFIDWYFKSQTNSYKKFEKSLIIKNKGKLENLLDCFDINRFNQQSTIKISYIFFINLYIYIYKLYNLNFNLNQKTYISTKTLTDRLSCSNSTINLYLQIMEYLGLMKIKKGSFKGKIATNYIISDNYKKFNDLDNSTVYIYSIISKQQFEEIKSCYEKIQPQQQQQLVKRGRGRPKKNAII